jgi:hypothetical protein
VGKGPNLHIALILLSDIASINRSGNLRAKQNRAFG